MKTTLLYQATFNSWNKDNLNEIIKRVRKFKYLKKTQNIQMNFKDFKDIDRYLHHLFNIF